MKINPRTDKRLQFNQLDAEARDRLRHFCHYTSAQAALQILQSGHIWSKDDELAPHFWSNRVGLRQAQGQEICLQLQFAGAGHLLGARDPLPQMGANQMYVQLHEWPYMYGLEGMRISELRVGPGTVSGLQCTGMVVSPDFLARCKTDLRSTMVLQRLKRLLATPRTLSVPATVRQRAQLAAEFPALDFSGLELLRMRFELWRKGHLKPVPAAKPLALSP
jgi:hypothetical protein